MINLLAFTQDIANFLNIHKDLVDNTITIILYSSLVIIALKGGAEWLTLVIAYLVLSAILSLLEIHSIFNIISLLTNLLKDLIQSFVDGIASIFS